MTLLLVALARAAAPTACENVDREGLDPSVHVREYGSVDATRKTIGAATEEAQQIAKRKLLDALAQGIPAAQRRDLERKIRTRALSNVEVGAGKYVACAVAFTEREHIDRVRKDMEALARSVGLLARTVAEKAGGRPVWIVPSETPEGCRAGALGRSFDARLRSALANHAVTLAGVPGSDVVRLRAILDPNGAQGIPVSAALYQPGSMNAETGDGFGFTFNPFVLVDEPGEAVADAQDGCGVGAFFPEGGSIHFGRDGLQVTPRLVDQELCEGERIELTIATSAPALVQAFSVDADGSAFVTAPLGPGGRRVTKDAPWTALQVDAIPLYPPRTEHLLVAAVPLDVGLTATRDWADCRVPDRLDPADFPKGTAFTEVRFRVTPAGQPGCEAARPITYEEGDPVGKVCGK